MCKMGVPAAETWKLAQGGTQARAVYTAGATAVGRGCSPRAGCGGGGQRFGRGSWNVDQRATAASEGVHREAADGCTRNVDHGRTDVQSAVGTRPPPARPARRGRFATGPALGHTAQRVAAALDACTATPGVSREGQLLARLGQEIARIGG